MSSLNMSAEEKAREAQMELEVPLADGDQRGPPGGDSEKWREAEGGGLVGGPEVQPDMVEVKKKRSKKR